MSTEQAYLSLRLEGPLQAWGFDSQYSRRNTGLMPSKSAILGMCCAALGLPRGSEAEAEWLGRLRSTRLLAIDIPRPAIWGNGKLAVRRLMDYHTVQDTKTAEGKFKDTHLTFRQYLCDAAFGAVLSGSVELLEPVAAALDNPVWGLWLGRKACVPTAPVLGGLFHSREEALRVLIGDEPLERFTYQLEVDQFEEGRDTLPDQPVSFGSEEHPRAFAPRRVRTESAKLKNE